MSSPTAWFILAIIAIIAVFIVGGRVKISEKGIEIDTSGFLEWLRKAREEKASKAKAVSETIGRPPREIDARELVSAERARKKVPTARILWVDDHPINNVFERQALASAGVFADAFTTNGEAEEALRRRIPYDLIISDITRDNRTESGWDLLNVANNQRVPILFYVGYVDADRRVKAEQGKARGITANPDELMTFIAQTLRVAREAD